MKHKLTRARIAEACIGGAAELYNSPVLAQAMLNETASENILMQGALLDWHVHFHHHVPRKVIEFACGTGTLTRVAADRYLHAMGIDSAPDLVARAKAQATEYEMYVVADITDFDQTHPRLRGYDYAALSWGTMSYLTPEKLQRHLKAAYNSLNAGGVYYLGLGNYTNPDETLFSAKPKPIKVRKALDADDFDDQGGYYVGEYEVSFDEVTGEREIMFYVATRDKSHIVSALQRVQTYTIPRLLRMASEAGFTARMTLARDKPHKDSIREVAIDDDDVTILALQK